MRNKSMLVGTVLFSFAVVAATFNNDGLNVSENVIQRENVYSVCGNTTAFTGQKTSIYLCDMIAPNETHLNDTRNAEQMLGRFVGRLKSYIKETRFDTSEFEKATEDLKKEFSLIISSIEKLTPSSEDLILQLTIAKHVFHAMVDFTWHFSHYRNFSAVGYHLVYKLIELRVRVLALQNSHGKLDLHVDGYVGELSRLRDSSEFWAGRFRQLRNLSFEVVQMYYKHFNRLDRTLSAFASQIPKESTVSSTEYS